MKISARTISMAISLLVFLLLGACVLLPTPTPTPIISNCSDINFDNEQDGGGELPTSCVDLEGGGFARAETVLTLGCTDEQLSGAEITSDIIVEISEELKAIRLPGDDPAELERKITSINNDESIVQSGCTASFDYVIDGDGDSTFGSPGLILTVTQKSTIGYIPGSSLHVNQIISNTGSTTGNGVRVYVFDAFCSDYNPGERRNDYSQKVNQHPHDPPKCTHGESVISMAQLVAPGATYIGVPVLDHNAVGYLSGLLNALEDIGQELQTEGDRPPVVLNFSLGVRTGPMAKIDWRVFLLDHFWERFKCKVSSDIGDCSQVNGIAFVAAAGNMKGNSTDYPAAFPLFISVSASKGDGSGTPASYTNPGVLSAPGGDSDVTQHCGASVQTCIIVSNTNAARASTSALWGGTSFSAPLAAGAAALILEQKPSLTPLEVREILRVNSDPTTKMLNVDKSVANIP